MYTDKRARISRSMLAYACIKHEHCTYCALCRHQRLQRIATHKYTFLNNPKNQKSFNGCVSAYTCITKSRSGSVVVWHEVYRMHDAWAIEMIHSYNNGNSNIVHSAQIIKYNHYANLCDELKNNLRNSLPHCRLRRMKRILWPTIFNKIENWNFIVCENARLSSYFH